MVLLAARSALSMSAPLAELSERQLFQECLDSNLGSMEVSRLHAAVKSEPVCGDHSACRRYMRAFQSRAIARNPRLVDFGALSTPYPRLLIAHDISDAADIFRCKIFLRCSSYPRCRSA